MISKAPCKCVTGAGREPIAICVGLGCNFSKLATTISSKSAFTPLRYFFAVKTGLFSISLTRFQAAACKSCDAPRTLALTLKYLKAANIAISAINKYTEYRTIQYLNKKGH